MKRGQWASRRRGRGGGCGRHFKGGPPPSVGEGWWGSGKQPCSPPLQERGGDRGARGRAERGHIKRGRSEGERKREAASAGGSIGAENRMGTERFFLAGEEGRPRDGREREEERRLAARAMGINKKEKGTGGRLLSTRARACPETGGQRGPRRRRGRGGREAQRERNAVGFLAAAGDPPCSAARRSELAGCWGRGAARGPGGGRRAWRERGTRESARNGPSRLGWGAKRRSF